MAEQEVEHPSIPETDAPTLGHGRYRLASKLGEGGMAAVYRAWDTDEREWRAIKVLLPEFARRAKLRIRFANEAQTMLKLNHRHLVTVFDVGMDEELPFIVMELADGGCVIDWIDRYGPMPARMAVDILMQVCKGLGAAHAIGVVHRDVKPHNILITHRGVCRVTDFGIAQIDDGGGMTKTGSVMGTLGYMAPEQRTDAKNVDVRADIYGLGATLYKLVTGGSVADLFLAEHDAEMLEGVPDALVPIVLKATAYKPVQRYSTVNELAKALHGAKQHLPPDPEDTPDLAMPPGPEVPTGLPNSELSEPTFLPQDLPDPRPSVTGPQSARSTQPSEEDDSDPPSTPLPYFMPEMQARRTDSDEEEEVPDYIDQSAIVKDEGSYTVQLDDDTKRRVAEARALAIKEGRIDDDGNALIDDEGNRIEPPSTAGDGIGDTFGDVLHTLLRAASSVLGRPLQFIFIFAMASTVGGVAVVGTTAKEVRQAQVHAQENQQLLYEVIEHEQRVVEDLVALGGSRELLTMRYFVFTDSTAEPARMDAAMMFITSLEGGMSAAESSGQESTKLHKLHMARGRMEKILDARTAYLEAMITWEEAADSPQGRTAIKLGAANQP